MKRIIKVLTLAALAIMPLSAMAQKNISNAIDIFGSNTGKYGIWHETKDDGAEGAYSVVYEFRLPKKQENKLDMLRKAFYEDKSVAYEVFIKKAGDTSRSNKFIAYGDNLDKKLSLGGISANEKRNYLFMFVENKEQPDYRYVYGIEWHYNGKNVEGSVVKIYSLNPKKVKKTKTAFGNLDNFMSGFDNSFKKGFDESFKKGFDVSGKVGKKFKMPEFMGSDIQLDGNGLRMKNGTMEMKDGKTIIQSGKKSIVINPDGTVKMDDGDGNVMTVDNSGNILSQEGTSAYNDDPIQQFGNLRAAYLNNLREGNVDNTTLLTGLANSILDLCKKKGQQMTAAEKQLCTDGLKDMQEQTPDKFIKGIFGVAISEINKYSKK